MPLRQADVLRHLATKEARGEGQSNDPIALITNAALAQDSAASDTAADSNDSGYYDYPDDDFSERQYATEEWENPPSVNSGKGCTLAAALCDLVARIDRGQPIIETLQTGVALFDETTGGLVRGECVGIAAPPGAGKSTIADVIVLGILRNQPKASALIFNLETATAVRAARLVAGQSVRFDNSSEHFALHAPIGALLRCQLPETEQAHARSVAKALSEEIGERLCFVDYVHDAEGIAELIRTTRPDVVLVDHLGLVTLGDVTNSKVEQTDSVLHVIADAIRTVNAAGILISEVNKLALYEKVFDLASVRGSARFASLVGMMVGIMHGDIHEGDDPHLLLHLAKNRHGRAGVQQRAILYGGMSYVYFEPTVGSLAPEAKNARNRGWGQRNERY